MPGSRSGTVIGSRVGFALVWGIVGESVAGLRLEFGGWANSNNWTLELSIRKARATHSGVVEAASRFQVCRKACV